MKYLMQLLIMKFWITWALEMDLLIEDVPLEEHEEVLQLSKDNFG